MIPVEVAYALPQKQKIVAFEVADDCTATEAVRLSRIEEHFDGLNVADAKLGIYGKALPNPEKYVMKAGDRIEIYRPLIADPKEVRKARAAKAKKK